MTSDLQQNSSRTGAHRGSFTIMKTIRRILTVIVSAALVSVASAATSFHLLHKFVGGETGSSPSSGLIFDAAGNLYGELVNPDYSSGIVYKLTPNPDGTWSETVLYEFADVTPEGGLVFDSEGNLYGAATTAFGGGPGLVFKLSPNPDETWTETVLYSFSGGADGSFPRGGVLFDTAGNLYGTATYGGNLACQGALPGCGVVYKLEPNPDGTWTESVIHSFDGGADGANPQAGLIFDPSGNLYSTTQYGGSLPCQGTLGCGTVFELSPQPDGSWIHTVILAFPGEVGGNEPLSPVVMDATGNLYGTTIRGGGSKNGIIFQLVKNADGSWMEKILHQFTGGKDGSWPDQGLILDDSGNLYGTARYDGEYGYGLAFRLKKHGNGKWTGHQLHQFDYGFDGGFPMRMVFDAAGNLFGTTFAGGGYGYGTVFELIRQPQ